MFSKSTFGKNSFRNTITVSNSLDQDQARCSVGPDLGPNCLQRLSADDTSFQLVNNEITPLDRLKIRGSKINVNTQ